MRSKEQTTFQIKGFKHSRIFCSFDILVRGLLRIRYISFPICQLLSQALEWTAYEPSYYPNRKILIRISLILSVTKSAGFSPIRYVEISQMNNEDKRWLEVRAVVGFSNVKYKSYLKILLSVNRLKFKANKQMSYLNRITLTFWKLESFLKASRILKNK